MATPKIIDLRTSCVAHWKMNDELATTVVVDSSGNGYYGTAQQNTSVLHTTGKVGGALTFNGTTDYIDTGNAFQSTFRDSFSVNLWVKIPHNTNKGNTLIGQGNASPSNICELQIDSTDGDDKLVFVFVYETPSGVVLLSIPSDKGGAFSIFQLDVFQMITVNITQVTESSVKIGSYINNQFIAETPEISCEMVQYTIIRNLYLGAVNGSTVEAPLNGSLDNVMIFNKTLSIDEISFLWNNGNGTESLYGVV
jgi:hypothetical protein